MIFLAFLEFLNKLNGIISVVLDYAEHRDKVVELIRFRIFRVRTTDLLFTSQFSHEILELHIIRASFSIVSM